ncbi:hypothetical protein [Fibrella forsythiae]|uniref:Uncharacterized protein n=1 Tax=Fibrella forsythiae TaxID=2817061 RepID=A0ABS3JKZ9_9BACT|nr:hypothetical protein [Fibrella forsythiae]MBO0950673.1 hypothetical protein [Fibrella forsythiae]
MTTKYFIDDWIGTQDRANDLYEISIKFDENGFFTMQVGSIEAKGNWRYDSIDKILTLFPPDQKFTITPVNNNHFVMSSFNRGPSCFFIRKTPKAD